MAIQTLKLSPTFLEEIVAQTLAASSLRLGVIITGAQVSDDLIETAPNSIINAEYNGAGWVRPSLTLTGNGAYNSTTDKWSIPDNLEWSITAPTGGLSIKQVFAILGGTTAPRNTTGILIGVCTYANAIVIPEATSLDLKFSADLFVPA